MAHGRHPDLERLLEDQAYAQAAADAMQALAAPSRLRLLARLHAGCGSCATSGSSRAAATAVR
jgi:DNA-binding transcriptional ArsR family regulator